MDMDFGDSGSSEGSFINVFDVVDVSQFDYTSTTYIYYKHVNFS